MAKNAGEKPKEFRPVADGSPNFHEVVTVRRGEEEVRAIRDSMMWFDDKMRPLGFVPEEWAP
jgi:hypothetical protein